MIDFEPNDPYPILPAGSLSYVDAKAHAVQADAWLGFECERIEAELVAAAQGQTYESRPTQQNWVGLPVQALQTPYTELRYMLERILGGGAQTVVDLGAGYGRMGLVAARYYPQLRFCGIECVPERVAEGRRIFCAQKIDDRAQLNVGDITVDDFQLPKADVYFIYDFGHRVAIEQILASLRDLSLKQKVTVIGRGRATRDAIERQHRWLSGVVPPENCGNFGIYRSA